MPLLHGGACVREKRSRHGGADIEIPWKSSGCESLGVIVYEASHLSPSLLFTIPLIECDLDYCYFQLKSIDEDRK